MDNGSRPTKPLDIDEYIQLVDNHGFAKGMNIGIACSRESSDIAIINNDCEVTAGWLDEIQKTWFRNPYAGIISPIVQNCCNPKICGIGMPVEDFQIDHIPAVCWFIPRWVIKEVGMFDPAYELGWCEDIDYCQKVLSANRQIWVSGRSFVKHKGSQTSKDINFNGARERNMEYYNKKWGK